MIDKNKILSAITHRDQPTDADLIWAKKLKNPWDRTIRSQLYKNVKEKKFWRLNYLLENFADQIDIDNYYDHERYCGYYNKDYLLGYAMYQDDYTIFKRILEFGAVKICGEDRNVDATEWAIVNRSSDFVNDLIDLYKKDFDIPNIFKAAIRYNQVGTLAKFLNEFEYDINDETLNPLYIAAKKGALKSAKYLLEQGADPTALGGAILREAKINGVTELVPLLHEFAEKMGKNFENLNDNKQKPKTEYQKLSDVELLEINKLSKEGFCLTTVFNFQTREVIRTQYLDPDKSIPAIHVRNFKDFEEIECLKKAFEMLQSLGGKPPSLIPQKNITKIEMAPLTKQKVSK